MKKFFLFLCATLILSGCVINKLDTSHRIIDLRSQNPSGREASVEVAAGDSWSSRMKAGPLVFNVLPQAALWIENGEGELLETLYVTGADFKKLKHAAKHEDGEKFYLECLPLWSTKAAAAGKKLPSKDNPYPDTVTSATPMADFTLLTSISSDDAAFVFFELNKSDDTNSVYTEENNGWAGQPSVIYSADISGILEGGTVRLYPSGHGGKLNDEPGIYTDMMGIDTALKQVEMIEIEVR